MPKLSKPVTQPAWDLFQKGDLGGADRAAAAAMQQSGDPSVSPIPDLMVIKAFYQCRLERYREAREIFGRVLEFCPDDAYAQQGYLLSLADELSGRAAAPGDAEKSRQGRLLLGLGTGRCGSTTLTKLWQVQQSCYCSHEHPPRLPWAGSASRLAFHEKRFDVLRAHHDFVGDVAHWWLPAVETVMQWQDDIRVVVLQRDREATADSFLKIKGGSGKGAINHWIEHDGQFWARNIWDECYPSYETRDMREAILDYWQDYYTHAEGLAEKFPSVVRIFQTENLGAAETQAELLAFCGFRAPKIRTDLHLNKGTAGEGVDLY